MGGSDVVESADGANPVGLVGCRSKMERDFGRRSKKSGVVIRPNDQCEIERKR